MVDVQYRVDVLLLSVIGWIVHQVYHAHYLTENFCIQRVVQSVVTALVTRRFWFLCTVSLSEVMKLQTSCLLSLLLIYTFCLGLHCVLRWTQHNGFYHRHPHI